MSLPSLTVWVSAAVSREIADPDAFADGGFAVFVAHFREERSGFRILGEVVEGGDAGVALHVGLTGEDVDLQRSSLSADGGRGGEQDGEFHRVILFLGCFGFGVCAGFGEMDARISVWG